MKRILCALLALLFLTGAGLAEASGNLLGLRLLAGMTDGTQNAAISPLSLQMALSLAREGAAGETRAELDALLASLRGQEAAVDIEEVVVADAFAGQFAGLAGQAHVVDLLGVQLQQGGLARGGVILPQAGGGGGDALLEHLRGHL